MNQHYLYFLALVSARTVVIALFLMVALRLSGKRRLGQFNLYDLAMIMALANAVQNAMTAGTGNLTTGIVCAGTLFLIGRVIAGLFTKIPTIEQTLIGVPVVLAQDGELIPDNLEREAISKDDVMMALRSHGLGKIADAKLVVLEPDGSLSVIPTDKPAHA